MRAMSGASLAAAAVLMAATATFHADARSAPPAVVPGHSQELPDGPGKDELKRLCVGCHDLTFTVSTHKFQTSDSLSLHDGECIRLMTHARHRADQAA